MALGEGFLTILHTDSTTSAWIGFQCLFGIGYGLAIQAPINLLQEVFKDEKDVSMATSIVILYSQLGRTFLPSTLYTKATRAELTTCLAAVALSIHETVFSNSLTGQLGNLLPEFETDHHLILRHGMLQLRNRLEKLYPEISSQTLFCYNEAIASVLRVAVVLAALSVLRCFEIGWKLKRRN